MFSGRATRSTPDPTGQVRKIRWAGGGESDQLIGHKTPQQKTDPTRPKSPKILGEGLRSDPEIDRIVESA